MRGPEGLEGEVLRLRIVNIKRDPDTQARVELRSDVIERYAVAVTMNGVDGAKLPPPVVFFDGSRYWLADGYYRVAAHVRQKVSTIECFVAKGGRLQAVAWAVKANEHHGQHRTNADKRRAVEIVLRQPEWADKSNKAIAEMCRVDDKTVKDVIEKLGIVRDKVKDTTGRDQPAKKARTAGTAGTADVRKSEHTRPKEPGVEDANRALAEAAGTDAEPEPVKAPPSMPAQPKAKEPAFDAQRDIEEVDDDEPAPVQDPVGAAEERRMASLEAQTAVSRAVEAMQKVRLSDTERSAVAIHVQAIRDILRSATRAAEQDKHAATLAAETTEAAGVTAA